VLASNGATSKSFNQFLLEGTQLKKITIGKANTSKSLIKLRYTPKMYVPVTKGKCKNTWIIHNIKLST